MADEEVEGEHEQSIRDTPDRDRDPSASALTRLKDDRAHAGIENGTRPIGTGQSVTHPTPTFVDDCLDDSLFLPW